MVLTIDSTFAATSDISTFNLVWISIDCGTKMSPVASVYMLGMSLLRTSCGPEIRVLHLQLMWHYEACIASFTEGAAVTT